AACVWMGYDNTDATHCLPQDATGGTYPAQLLKQVFASLYPDGANAPEFTMPEGIVKVRLDSDTLHSDHVAVLASAMTPEDSAVYEYYAAGTEPTKESDYWSTPKTPGDFSVSPGEDGLP